jgi:GTP-binding protein
MARLPVVAIIGRPNTGKSTLFNSLLKKRVAIVSEVPGTTRDHIAGRVQADPDYLLLDTGGMGGGTVDKDFEEDVHEQSLLAVTHADLILFTVNAREEITSSDHEVVRILRRKRKRHVPVILVINKCDNPEIAEEAEAAFQELGIGDDTIPISAISNIGTVDVRDAIAKHLKQLHFANQEAETPVASTVPRVAIVGKPNVGKSSLINALMSDADRSASPRLVSDIPGTTRDTTDTVIRREEKEFLFVDTAGLRKQARVEEDLESYAVLRTIQALEEADIATVVLDATQPISKQDKHIVGMAIDLGKGIILVLNKIDLLTAEQKEEKAGEISYAFPFCRYAPVLATSAVTRDHLPKLFDLIEMVQRNRLRRLPMKELHAWMKDQVFGKPMGALSTAKHITQAEDPPPTFVLFVKNPKLVRVSQLRYLDNRLRETFDLTGTPVRWITKGPRDRA